MWGEPDRSDSTHPDSYSTSSPPLMGRAPALNLMASLEDMGALKVGYIIAYEHTIKEARSWSRLITMSAAVKSAN